MEILKYPVQDKWPVLLRRPDTGLQALTGRVEQILKTVRGEGDSALISYTKQFDGINLNALQVSENEMEEAEVDTALRDAINLSINSLTVFHKSQMESIKKIETAPGVFCWRKSVPIERVGFYIPGGSAPLFSTVLMLAVPASIAGCKDIILCTPPGDKGNVHPAILYSARITGISDIFKVGGAQAVAAMAYGTESIPRVDKIFGPGNNYVTIAKQLVSMEGIAIDLPAGPSEVAVVGDDNADADIIACDLLSQAEHGPDSQVVFITNSQRKLTQVEKSINEIVRTLPRADLATEALKHSKLILLHSLDEIMAMINAYAPEHLILSVKEAEIMAGKVENAGSVFLGYHTPESAGDYASGTNHTLPTAGFARSYSGVSLDSFIRKITFQTITPDGLKVIGPAVMTMARKEGLLAHSLAVSRRLDKLKGKGRSDG